MDDSIAAKKWLIFIEKRKKHPLKSNDKDITELLSQCKHADIESVKIAVAVLLYAVQKNWLDLATFIPDLQLAISTASHSHLLVFLLCDFLRLPNFFTSTLLKGHPLVAIAINNPTLITHCITGTVNLIKKHLDVHSFNVTKPFFKYILLQPDITPSTLHLADTLHEQLLHLSNELQSCLLSNNILNMLLSICSFYQCSTIGHLWSTVNRINGLCKSVVHNDNNRAVYSNQLVHYCLSLCMECTTRGLPIDGLVSNLKHLLSFSYPTISSCLCLSWLLLNHLIDSHITKSLLEIIQDIFASFPDDSCLLPLFKLPLVAIVSQNSLLLTKSIKSIANQLISTLEESNIVISPNKDVTVGTLTTSWFSSQYTSLIVLGLKYMEYIKEGKLEFEVISSHYSGDMISLGIITCAIDPVKTCHLMLPHLMKKKSNMGSTLLSFVMYSLAHINQQDHQTRFSLLISLPSLCSHSSSVCTELVTKTLLTFAKQLDLRPTAIRLLTQVWENNDKIFPSLRDLLLPPLAGPCKVEWSIASAASLRDICTLRPEVHGEECLPYISQLLSYSQHPLMISLLVSALNSLCMSGIIESPGSLWKLLGPQLATHDNPGVDKALCEFFSLASDFGSDKERLDNKLFHEEALKCLWKLTLKPNMTTVESALRTLTSFPMDSHTLNVLPEQLVSFLMDQLAGEERDKDSPLSSSQLFSLFLLLTKPLQHASSCLDILVNYLVNKDIELLPRGTVFNALKKLPSSESNFEKIHTDLNYFLDTFNTHDGKAPATFYLLNGMRNISNDRPSVTKQREHLLQTLKKTLEFCGVGIHGNDLWTFNEGLLWCEFMNKLIEIEIKLPDKGDKREEMQTKAINKVFLTLKDLVRHSLDCGIAAIMGVVCASLETTPKFLLSLIECLTQLLTTGVLPWQPSSLYDTLQVLLTVSALDNLLQSFLLHLPILSYHLSNYPWVALEMKLELTQLVSALATFLQKVHNVKLVQLTLCSLSYFIQDIPYIKEAVSSFLMETINWSEGPQNDTLMRQLSLSMVNEKRSVPDTIDRIIHYIQSDSAPIKVIQVLSCDIATWLPLLACTGKVAFDDAMKCVQVLAELATRHRKVPELHLFLGTVVHDLYMTGAGPSLGGLMESLAVRWIQEGLCSMNQISDTNQLLSPMYGIAGLLGLSTLNYKLTDCVDDNFVQSLLSSSISFLCQCCSISDQSIKNTALQVITLTHTKYLFKTIDKKEIVPPDYSYLPEGYSLSSIGHQLHQYCIGSNGTVVTNQQVHDIVKGLALIKTPLPPVKWDFILLSVLSKNDQCQESVIKFVANQVSHNQHGISNTAKFITHPMILNNTLNESTKKVLIESLVYFVEILSPSHLFSIFISTGDLVCCVESLLSLLSSDNCTTKLKSLLALVLKYICNEVEVQLKESQVKDIFQPSTESNFFYTLSQCLTFAALTVPDSIKKIITCCHMILGDKSITPNLYEYLDDSTSTPPIHGCPTLEDKWLIHAIHCLCSKQNNSFYETLLLTKIQEWSKENTKPTDAQLERLVSLIVTIVGGKVDTKVGIIQWPAVEDMQGKVLQKICELAVFWFCDDRQPFHDTIKDLLRCLRHSSNFAKMTVWTSVAQLL